MKRRGSPKTFGRADPREIDTRRRGLRSWWGEILIGRRAMIVLFGGILLMTAPSLFAAIFKVDPPRWMILPSVLCGVGGLVYAYTRRCPSCGAASVIKNMGPQRECEECGTRLT